MAAASLFSLGPILSLLVPVDGLAAQTAPGTPHPPAGGPSAAVQAAQLPSREELHREPTAPTPTKPKVSVRDRGAVRAGPCPDALVNSTLTTDFNEILFTAPKGAPPLPAELVKLLAPVASEYRGPAKPIRAVCDIRNAANAALLSRNYVAAVRVPDQTIQGGRLTFEVITAHITSFRVRGDAGPLNGRIQALLRKLQDVVPLNTREAEHVLLLANDIPGLTVTLELAPSPSGLAGEVVGDVTVERSRGTLLFNAQNYGSHQIGRYAGLARAEIYGLTGLGDRTYVSAFSTAQIHEQQVVQVGHDMLLTRTGLRLSGEFTYAWTRPDLAQEGGDINLTSKAILATIALNYPLIRSIGANANIGGGFDLIEQRVKTLGVPINTDKMRIFYARANADLNERAPPGDAPKWHFGGSVEVRKGTTLFGASRTGTAIGGAFPTRFEGDPQAWEVRGSYQTELRARFGPRGTFALTGAVDARGQWSNKPLLAFEEFAVGNLTIGRGYDPGVTSGDRAVGGTFELRLGKPLPQSRKDLAYEAVGFYDAVRIWNLDTGSTENDRQLRSFGGGARISWGDHARLDVVYAHPLDKALSFDDHRSSDRLLVSLVVRALPWRW